MLGMVEDLFVWRVCADCVYFIVFYYFCFIVFCVLAIKKVNCDYTI